MKLKLKENNISKVIFGKIKKANKNNVVLFFDYDGTILYSYTKNDFMNITQFPSLPDRTNENLICDGWNWNASFLSEIKTRIANDEIICIGAIYHTADDKTHITYKPIATSPTTYVTLTPSVANAVTIDWGDGNTDTWTSTSSATKSHTYTGVTDSSVYDITISCTSGTYKFNTYFAGNYTNNRKCAYIDIKLSNKVSALGTNCFQDCYYLTKITIPNSVTSFGTKCFYNCKSLNSVNIPNTITSLGEDCFYYCYSLRYISIPNNITNLGKRCFAYTVIKYITMPSAIETIGESIFDNIRPISKLVIPNGITQIPKKAFSGTGLYEITIPTGVINLGVESFSYMTNLRTIIVPKTVSNISNNCFINCYGLKIVYMKPTIPPTLENTSAIPNVNELVIYVPRGTLSAYQNATNWSSFSSKMVEYDY